MKPLSVKSKGVNQLALIVSIMRKLNIAGEVDRRCGASPTNQPRTSHGSTVEDLNSQPPNQPHPHVPHQHLD